MGASRGEALHSRLESYCGRPEWILHIGCCPAPGLWENPGLVRLPNIHFTDSHLRLPGSLLRCTVNLGICKLSP